MLWLTYWRVAVTLKDQSSLLINAQKQEMEALQRVSEQEAQVAPLQHTVARLQKELESGKQHTEWLEQQVTEKTKSIQELRQTLAKNTHDFEEHKAQMTEELTSAKRQVENARVAAKKMENTLIHSKEQVKELLASKIHAEEHFQNELNAQRRLADLYKQSATDANTRVNELQELCDSLRKSLAESEQALSLETERSKEQVEHLFREQADASERRIEALQEELDAAHERIAELEKKKLLTLEATASIGDISSTAGEAHLAAHGLSPKQMFDHIVELEKSLQEERSEKDKLHAYMDRIVKEVQEKSPIIQGLRLDHDRAVASNTQLSEQLEVCMQELSKSKSKQTLALKEKQSYEKKCESLAQSVDDLSRQVQHLLFRSQDRHRRETSPGEVASENLVVFKDVEELQVRNQQLLTVIRELTEMNKRHSDDDGTNSDVDSTTSTHLIISGDSDDDSSSVHGLSSSIKQRLAIATKEIEELRAEREEEREMITAIVKQRDTYRVLLAQADQKYVDGSASSSNERRSEDVRGGDGQFSPRGVRDGAENRKLRELQYEFADYKKEKQANTKLLQDSLDQIRAECSQLKIAQMQAQVEATHNKDRYEAAEARYQDAEKEIIRLRAKADQLSSLILQHQRVITESEAKLEAATSRLNTLAIEKEGAVREAEFLRKYDEKSQQEMTTLRLDNTNLLKAMESSRKVDAAREEVDRHEIETQKRKIASLEAKLHEVYDKLDSKEAVSSANILATEREKQVVSKELEKLRETHSNVKEQLVRLEEQKISLDEKLALLQKENTNLHEQLRKGAGAAAAERVAALELQLRDTQREMQVSLVSRKSLADAVAKYKAIAEANEKSLTELSSASEQWKQSEHAKLQAAHKERDQLHTELRKAREELKEHITEGNKLREEIDRSEQTHKLALQQATERQKLMEVQSTGAQQELAAVREEMERMKVDLYQAQENYERELQLHAAEVSKAAESRRLVEAERKARVEKEGVVAALEAKLKTIEKTTKSEIDVLQKRLEEAADSKSTILEQNKLLHSQLERAAVQIRRAHEESLKKAAEKPLGTTDDATVVSNDEESVHNKEVDDLRSVIAFLRRESEIATSKLDLAQQEAQRFRTQIFDLESTIDRLRNEIKALTAATSATPLVSTGSTTGAGAPGSEHHAAHLEQLALLRESNATLRDENQKNLARLKDEEAKRKTLEEQLAPLKSAESSLKTVVDSLKQEIVSLNDANNRWKQRVEQLVDKYQQVDPVEHDKIVREREALTKEVAALKLQMDNLKSELETQRTASSTAVEEERTKSENWSKQYDRIKGFAKNWKNKAEALTKQLAEKNKEADDRTSSVGTLEVQVAALSAEKTALEAKLAASESSSQDSAAAASGAAATWEKERQELQTRLDLETKRATQLKEFNSRLMNGLKSLKKENSELKDQAQTTAVAAPPVPASDVSATAAVPVKPHQDQSKSSPAAVPLPGSASETSTAADTAGPSSTSSAPTTVSPPPSTTVSTGTVSGAAAPTSESTTDIPTATATAISHEVASAAHPAPAPPLPRVPAVSASVSSESVTKSTTTTVSTTSTTSSAGGEAKPAVTTAITTVTTAPPQPVVSAVAKIPTPDAPATTAPASQPEQQQALTAEEKLRMFALQSMKKQVGIGRLAAPSKSPPRPTPAAVPAETKVRQSFLSMLFILSSLTC